MSSRRPRCPPSAPGGAGSHDLQSQAWREPQLAAWFCCVTLGESLSLPPLPLVPKS